MAEALATPRLVLPAVQPPPPPWRKALFGRVASWFLLVREPVRLVYVCACVREQDVQSAAKSLSKGYLSAGAEHQVGRAPSGELERVIAKAHDEARTRAGLGHKARRAEAARGRGRLQPRTGRGFEGRCGIWRFYLTGHGPNEIAVVRFVVQSPG